MENIGVCKFVLQDWTAVKFVSIFASSMFICGLVQSLLKSVFVQALMDFWWVLLENLFGFFYWQICVPDVKLNQATEST